MSRKPSRPNGLRTSIAAAAARIMAEDGIDDFALAKRKAARQLGAPDTRELPGNQEIEAELRTYRALYQPDEHAERVRELRHAALEMMRLLERFHPYLTGPVLAGTAGPYAEVDIQVFPESSKDLEFFFLDRDVKFETSVARRYAGDRPHEASILRVEHAGLQFRITVHDPRDERLTLRKSVVGRAIERATVAEVVAMLTDRSP
jgi:hypothetical protein